MSNESAESSSLVATVMGLGSFGGGAGAVEYLHSLGMRVVVSDLRSPEQLQDTRTRLAHLDRVDWHLDGHQVTDFQGIDLLVVNPAIRPGHPLVEEARRCGTRVTSEMALFWERCRAPIAGVTGTNGKSTTTKLLHHLLESSGHKAWLGGNIGGSLLSHVDEIQSDDWVVLELSSFQLAALDELQVSPCVAVVTNFAPNHLDWHGSLDAYRQAKQTILRWQRANDLAVLNARNEVATWPTQARMLSFQSGDLPDNVRFCHDHPLRALHQQENAAAAVVAARAIGVHEGVIQDALQSYQGLPHRLRLVSNAQGRQWYDDSASTTPESTMAALAAFHEPIVLLVGGADKGVDLSALAREIVRRTRHVVLLGAVAPVLRKLIEQELAAGSVNDSPFSSMAETRTLKEAVNRAMGVSRTGDIILLSPGCASYGWFANYVERGLAFAELVRHHAV